MEAVVLASWRGVGAGFGRKTVGVGGGWDVPFERPLGGIEACGTCVEER